MHSKVEKQISKNIAKYYIMNIFLHADGFGYWNPVGFIPQILPNTILCLVGMDTKNDENIGEDCEEIVKREKAKFLIERTCQYKDLARKAREGGG